MRLIAKAIRISHAKFHCNRLTTVQDYASFMGDTMGDLLHLLTLMWMIRSS